MTDKEKTTAPAEDTPAAVNSVPAEAAADPVKEPEIPAKKTFDPHATLTVSTSPHIKSPVTTRSIMIDVLIALVPALIWGIYVFGLRALTVVLVSVASAVAAEAVYELCMRKPVTIGDCSAAVTGLLIGLNMPVTVPLWMPIIGSVFAIVIVKQLYGGLGKNFMNPALAARAFLMLAWPSLMTSVPMPFVNPPALAFSVSTADITASATPMQFLKNGLIPEGGLFNLLIGSKAGCIGEISALLLLAGGIYLMVRKVITWHIPVSYMVTVAAIAYLFPKSSYKWEFTAAELICGGLILGAVYMATDYATSPVTARGRLLYGVGCGAITMLIRYFGGYAEGVTFAILIMNTLVWYIDMVTKPTRFGGVPSGK